MVAVARSNSAATATRENQRRLRGARGRALLLDAGGESPNAPTAVRAASSRNVGGTRPPARSPGAVAPAPAPKNGEPSHASLVGTTPRGTPAPNAFRRCA